MAGAYGLQPNHFHVSNVLKSGSFKLLEPSGPVQACNGIALFLLHILHMSWGCSFRPFCKITKNDYHLRHVCPSVRME